MGSGLASEHACFTGREPSGLPHRPKPFADGTVHCDSQTRRDYHGSQPVRACSGTISSVDLLERMTLVESLYPGSSREMCRRAGLRSETHWSALRKRLEANPEAIVSADMLGRATEHGHLRGMLTKRTDKTIVSILHLGRLLWAGIFFLISCLTFVVVDYKVSQSEDTRTMEATVRCGCGRESVWAELELRGVQEMPWGERLELRNCPCGSTLSVTIDLGNFEAWEYFEIERDPDGCVEELMKRSA